MTRLDRYVIANFLRIFLIALISMTGLFVVVHLFTNLDELLALVDKDRTMASVMLQFYGPRALDFFDRSLAILILLSGVFTLGMMQRRQEMTAIAAAGIPRLRMFKPLVFAALVLVCLAVASRELLLPRYRESLLSSAQDLQKPGASSGMTIHKDHVWGYLVRTAGVDSQSGVIRHPVVQLPIRISRQLPRIAGESGRLVPAGDLHAAGLLLEGVDTSPPGLSGPDLKLDSQTAVYLPANHPWLQPGQCLVVTSLSQDELAWGCQLTEYVSLPDMIAALRRPAQWYSQSNRIAVHSRVVRPLLDIGLMLVALPVVLAWSERNLFIAAILGTALTGLFTLGILGSEALGAYSLVRPAALAAWLPVIAFLPLAVPSARLLLR